jgi:putative oxidoreductase
MLLTDRIGQWADEHHPAWLDLFRIALGTFLFFKGIAFLNDIWALQRLLNNINLNMDSVYFAQGIAFIHLIGGFLIAIGLFTRLAIALQFPIICGAVLFNLPGGDYANVNPMIPGGLEYVWAGMNKTFNAEWWASVITLILMIVCYIFDSGPWSVERYLTKYEEE